MKQIFKICFCLLLFYSCRKEVSFIQKENGILKALQEELKDRVSPIIYSELNFSRIIRIKIKDEEQYFRISIKEKNLNEEFLLIRSSATGKILNGSVIKVLEDEDDEPYIFNGKVVIKDLKGKELVQSTITNGYFDFLKKPNMAAREATLEDPNMLPPVIVISYRKSDNTGYIFSSLFNLNYFLYGDDYPGFTYSDGNYYSSFDYYGGYTTNTYYLDRTLISGEELTQLKHGIFEEEAIQVDVDTYADHPAIDLEKYLKCFSSIPDAGANCSIEVFADIPVDSDPNKLLNYQTGSPGHTFVQITKSNGGQRVSQNIGFYPSQGWKVSLTNAPVDGKFVDNSVHEYNASLKMNINPQQLQSALLEMQRLSKSQQYDIDEYNCSDFALDVFNAARTIPLQIPLYEIPGGMTAGGSRTPQGLFNKLREMRNTNDPESNNITIDIYKAWVGGSSGPCN